jgi:hypothetical protein
MQVVAVSRPICIRIEVTNIHVAVISTSPGRRRSSGNMLPLIVLDKEAGNGSSIEMSTRSSMESDMQGESPPPWYGCEGPESRDVPTGVACNDQSL